MGPSLATALTDDLARHVDARWRVPSRLELEFEKHYVKLFLPSMRHGAGGARKRYAGLRADGEVEFVGMEVVRRDWTELAKEVQKLECAAIYLVVARTTFESDPEKEGEAAIA